MSIVLPPRRRKSRAEEEGKEGKRPSEEEQYDFFTKVNTEKCKCSRYQLLRPPKRPGMISKQTVQRDEFH